MHRKGFDATARPLSGRGEPAKSLEVPIRSIPKNAESAIADVFLSRLFAFVPTSRAAGLYQRQPPHSHRQIWPISISWRAWAR
mgnify:CR=1 FL=1